MTFYVSRNTSYFVFSHSHIPLTENIETLLEGHKGERDRSSICDWECSVSFSRLSLSPRVGISAAVIDGSSSDGCDGDGEQRIPQSRFFFPSDGGGEEEKKNGRKNAQKPHPIFSLTMLSFDLRNDITFL